MFICERMMNNCLKKISVILPRRKKTEPKLLWWTKVVVSIILLSGLIAYIYVLINLIIKETPSIQYSTDKLDSQQLFPVFDLILSDPNVTIYCFFVPYVDDGTISKNCSANIESFGNGYYTLTPTENDNGDRSFLNLTWDYTEQAASQLTFGAELDDIKNKYPDQTNLQNYINYLQDNVVYIPENMMSYIRIKWTRREYLIRDWTNYLGFPNRYISLRIAESIASTPATPGNNTTMILLSPYGSTNGYFETVETEKRNQTVISNIGSLGGAIGLLLGIYVILFGRSLLDPWGIFQYYCCMYKSRSKEMLRVNLQTTPLTEKNQLHYEKSKDQDISEIEEKLEFLTIRFRSLETILREYVVNSDFLDKLETAGN